MALTSINVAFRFFTQKRLLLILSQPGSLSLLPHKKRPFCFNCGGNLGEERVQSPFLNSKNTIHLGSKHSICESPHGSIPFASLPAVRRSIDRTLMAIPPWQFLDLFMSLEQLSKQCSWTRDEGLNFYSHK